MVDVNGQSATVGAVAAFHFEGASKGELVSEIHLPFIGRRQQLPRGESLLIVTKKTQTEFFLLNQRPPTL